MSSSNVGIPMIGSYINMMLYTLELVEAYIYYFASPRSLRDPIFLKCAVATSIVSDTVGTIAICAMIFITNLVFNATVTPRKLYWGFQTYVATHMISALIYQTFMVHRYWILSRNHVVSLFISLLILGSLGSLITLLANNLAIVTREVFRGSGVHTHERWIVAVLSTAILTDVSITAALLWELNRSGVYNMVNLQTRRLITRISSQAIKTGVGPCIFALITLISYVAYKNQNIATCFAYMLSRIYTLSLLFSLIYRDKLRPGGEWVDRVTGTLPTVNDSENASPVFPVFPAIPVPAVPKGSIQDSTGRSHNSTFSRDESSNPHTIDISNERPLSHSLSERKSLSLTELGVCEL